MPVGSAEWPLVTVLSRGHLDNFFSDNIYILCRSTISWLCTMYTYLAIVEFSPLLLFLDYFFGSWRFDKSRIRWVDVEMMRSVESRKSTIIDVNLRMKCMKISDLVLQTKTSLNLIDQLASSILTSKLSSTPFLPFWCFLFLFLRFSSFWISLKLKWALEVSSPASSASRSCNSAFWKPNIISQILANSRETKELHDLSQPSKFWWSK